MSSLRLCIVLKVRLPNTPYFRPYLTLPHVYRRYWTLFDGLPFTDNPTKKSMLHCKQKTSRARLVERWCHIHVYYTFHIYLHWSCCSVKANLCNTTDDCYPADLIVHQVPAVYINCSDNKCVCTGCFYSTNGYKSCGYKRCWQYVAATHTCEDLRKDQRTAFLLSLFLSFVGAANFYIEQYTLGMI